MSRLTRRSASQQLSQRTSISKNILNFSSDCAVDSKRNSQWWKNMSDTSRRNIENSQLNPNSGILNADSLDTEGENSQWWKNLPENDTVPLPNRVNNSGEVPDEKNEDLPERILSHSESDDNEEIFPKSIFASQERREQRPRKSRYSRAFNLNTESVIEDPVHLTEQNLEIEEFKNQLEYDNRITESPTSKVTKETKKRRKTKSIFSKKLVKRKFSDAFSVTDFEPEKSEHANEEKVAQKQDSTIEKSISKELPDEKPKEGLFNLNHKKKKYSEAFLNVLVEKIPEQEGDLEKTDKQVQTSDSSNHNKTVEISEMIERDSLMKTNFKRKYSEAIARSESRVQENSELSDEEIIIEEILTQKDASNVNNRSLNTSKGKKTNLHKTIDNSPEKEIYNTETGNTGKANLSKLNSKNKKSRNETLRNEKDDPDLSEEEIKTQKKAAEVSNRRINVTKEMKKSLSKRDSKSKKKSDAFLSPSSSKIFHGNEDKIENEIDETNYHSSHVKNNQILNKEQDELSDEENVDGIRKQEEAVEQSINITKEIKKNLFIRDAKGRKYSEAFVDLSASKIVEAEEQEHDEHKDNETISSRQHAKESLFQNREFSQARSNIFEGDDENKENNRAGTDFVEENSAGQRKESLEKLKNTNTKYSQAFLELISMQKAVEEERNIAANKPNENNNVVINKSIEEVAEREKSDNDTKFSSISSIDISEEIKNPLFRPKARKSLYSVKSVTKNSEFSKIQSGDEPQQHLEKSKTQRIGAKRISLRSTSPTESISHFFDESLISSTKLFINPNENKYSGSDGSVKKKRGRPLKSVSVVHENSEVTVKDKNFTPKRSQKSTSIENHKNVSDNENKMVEENKDTAKNLNSTSRMGRRHTSVDPENLSYVSNKMQLLGDSDTDPEKLIKSSNSKRGRKPKSVSRDSEDRENKLENETLKEDTNFATEKSVKNKHVTPKQDQKNKSAPKVPEDPEDNAFENDEIFEGEEIVQNIISTSKRVRKLKSEARVFDDPEDNAADYEIKGNKDLKSDDVKNKNTSSNRRSKIITRVHEDQENYVPENDIIEDDEELESNEPVKYKSYASKKAQKSNSITSVNEDLVNNASENKITDYDDNSESGVLVKNKNFTPKKSRKSKSTTKVSEDPEKNVPESEMTREDTSDLVKNKNVTLIRERKSKSVTRTAEDSYENVPTKNSESNEVVKKRKRGRPPKLISSVPKNVDNVDNMNIDNKEPDKSVKKKNSTSSRPTRLSVRTDENYDNELEDNRDAEAEEIVKNEYSKTRNSSVSNIPIQDVPVNEIFATEENNKEMDKQKKQKTVVSKIPKKMKTISNVLKQDNSKIVDDNMMLEENIDIESDEGVKRQILPSNNKNTRKSQVIKNVETHENNNLENEIFVDNVSEKSRQLSTALPVQSAIQKQRQSSKFNVENKLETETVSNITNPSSIARARSSKFSVNKNNTIVSNSGTWISQSAENTKPYQDNLIEKRHSKPSVKRIITLNDSMPANESENSDSKEFRKKLLKEAVKNMPHEKRNKPPPQVPVKKITDFFTKLQKNEKLKPIPKKTNNERKVSRPVCTARLINGKPYYRKRLYRGKYWCTPRLYKLLQNKIKTEYGDDTINESEKFMKFIVQSVQIVIRAKKYLKEEVDTLKKELAKYGIISTTYDFFCFCFDYLPTEYTNLAVPCSIGTDVPCKEDEVWKPIQF